MPRPRLLILYAGLLFAGLLLARLCHIHIVWVEEAYPTAAAIQLLDGKMLYRDVWFDKPPLSPMLYLLWNARTGVPLRVAGTVFVFGCCWLLYRLAARQWSEREGVAAAAFLGFFLTFGVPSAVMPLAPDLLMVAPHIAALYFALRGKPLLAGFLAGTALLVNGKAIFILLACLCWLWRDWFWTLLGFLIPNIIAFGWFGRPYYTQVWEWGAVYSQQAFSFSTGIIRTADWIGFHAALVVCALWWLSKDRSWRVLAWIAVSTLGVAAGWRFFPRYYFQLLVPMAFVAARGYVLLGRSRPFVLLFLLVPLIRFGPRYTTLANDLIHGSPHNWVDLRLNLDSEAVSRVLGAKPGTLLVWGYRPDVFAYTRMPAGTRFLDSQPLTGVLADRHLTNSAPAFSELAARNRRDLVRTRPVFIVDGLGLLNPALAITNYPDLREWLNAYHEIGRTELSVIYERTSP